MDSSSGDGKQRTRLRHVILVLLIWMFLYKNVRSCSSTDCNAVLREAEGGFTSPCYPQNYPNLLTCTWKMQAPPGYIIQLSFLDFELEEASGCMYDQVVVNMGNADAKFCGLTANGLTLNSTGNFMELSFKSDFSVRKRGFSVSFRHVAVALRNQKVTVNNGNGQVAMVSSSVAIPTLLELTVCFEVERIANKQREWLFSYYGSGNSVKLSFGSDQSGTKVVVDGELCPVGSIISTADFTSSMRPLCLTWTSSKGQLAVYFNGVFSNVNCSASINHFVPAGGIFQLGGQQSFDGNIYNLRLWNHTMTVEELRSLTCDQEGNVIDWDNSHWTVPSSLVQIDNTLSCSVNTPFSSGCTTMGCPEDLFYRVSFWTTSELSQQAVERAVSLLLNQAFHKWTHSVEHFSVVKTGAGSNRFSCQALLLISNESLSADDVSAQLTGRRLLEDSQLQLFSVSVRLIENCQEDVFLNYYWPETRPRTTQLLPCFPDKNQSATRTCLINLNDYSPYWASADFTNCTVTAENAADVAEKLANFTRNGLSDDEISHVVTKVQQLVNVAKIDAAVAESVVSIISNVMTSSEAVLGNASNIALRTVDELAQKLEFDGLSVNITSKHLALGILAFNATTFNGSSFSAFIPPNSADPKIEFEQTANPLAQVTLPGSLLSGVSLSDADRSSLSRINFVFFSNTNLFKKEQDSLSLNSYVVASSVGNLSIRDLKDPVRIQIAHLTEQTSSHRFCMFWDFTLNNGDGGWNERGCSVSKESTRNKTICLCNHLTHFGVLMDVSQTSSQIDPKNKKILTFLSYIGCGVSAICAAATLLTYIAFEKLRRDYPSKILMNLSTSLLCLNMVFLLDGWLASMVDSAGLCTSAAVLLHYFLLTSFTWMGLESIHMYIALVKVFNTYIRRYILKFCAVGWGLPAVIVGIVVTVDKSHYGILEDSKDESAKMCWIKNQSVFYTTCVGYFCLVFLLNVAMFIVVMMQICGRNGKRSNRSLREEVLRNLRSVVSLTFLLGMTWGFALFAWGPVYLAFTYLFTIFNSLQGVFIFIFHCALKENVQKQWRRYLCCGPYRQSDNSDLSKTPTNNTKKVSSDNLAKSLSSSSFGSSTSNWTSKAKATLTPFSKRYRNAGPWRVIERRSYILRCLATARRSYGHFKGHHENGTYHCREVFIRIIEVSHTYDVWVMLLYGVLTPHSSRL
ncbi:adhesion G-protein coupled receptor G6 isoform X9 [Oryzias latipes]|uniref:adhesion G-protein coupled receptor G6 isoform X9 n=1 Tax=Oryzias latipes TaxID=8090 RepID=UPI000CE1E2CA|nr:adhesion G-protein coupled receptor G6 isoform X9 [Oryzias latipes]